MIGAAHIGVLLALSGLAEAQGTAPREKPSGYPAHVEAGKFTLAAEYLVHSIPTPEGVLITNDFLVVEAAFFGPLFTRLKLSNEQFTLRINGKKDVIFTQTPGLVAASLKYPDWQQHPRLTGTAGNGNGEVIVGQPTPVPRYPGDPNARPAPLPRPPEQENRSGIEAEPTMPIEERIERASLPGDERALPAAGLLFFPFRGKVKSLHTLDLIYDGPAGKLTVNLLK